MSIVIKGRAESTSSLKPPLHFLVAFVAVSSPHYVFFFLLFALIGRLSICTFVEGRTNQTCVGG